MTLPPWPYRSTQLPERNQVSKKKENKMKNSNREFLLGAIADFPELKDLPHMDELIANALDDETAARLNAKFEAEMDANPPKEIEWDYDVTPATKVPGKTPAAAPAPAPSTRTKPITIRVSGVVIDGYKRHAQEHGTAYQKLMNRTLKAAMLTWPKTVSHL